MEVRPYAIPVRELGADDEGDGLPRMAVEHRHLRARRQRRRPRSPLDRIGVHRDVRCGRGGGIRLSLFALRGGRTGLRGACGRDTGSQSQREETYLDHGRLLVSVQRILIGLPQTREDIVERPDWDRDPPRLSPDLACQYAVDVRAAEKAPVDRHVLRAVRAQSGDAPVTELRHVYYVVAARKLVEAVVKRGIP